jgi:hypothetical protein
VSCKSSAALYTRRVCLSAICCLVISRPPLYVSTCECCLYCLHAPHHGGESARPRPPCTVAVHHTAMTRHIMAVDQRAALHSGGVPHGDDAPHHGGESARPRPPCTVAVHHMAITRHIMAVNQRAPARPAQWPCTTWR